MVCLRYSQLVDMAVGHSEGAISGPASPKPLQPLESYILKYMHGLGFCVPQVRVIEDVFCTLCLRAVPLTRLFFLKALKSRFEKPQLKTLRNVVGVWLD